MKTSELLKKVRRIELKTKGLSSQMFSGTYRTNFKGRGMSFAEVRPYQYGDDVRSIDWNVTARTNTPHVKVFEEERELVFMLLIDLSRSAFFGTSLQTKKEIITEVAATLAFSAISNNDKVGVIFFSDKVEKYIPPRKGQNHSMRIIRELLLLQPERQQTNLSHALRYLNNLTKRRCTAFLISDFLDDQYEDALRVTANKHDLIGIRIYDPREESLPEVGLLPVVDAETGQEAWIDTRKPAIREAYAAAFQANQQRCQALFGKNGADLVNIRTDQPYMKTLIRFFKERTQW